MGTYHGGPHGTCTYGGPLLAEAHSAWWASINIERARHCAQEAEAAREAEVQRRMQESGFSELLAGGDLHEGQSMTYPDGHSKFAFQDDGTLVVYRNGAAIWATNTSSALPKPAKFVVQDDGNLVLCAADGQFAGWASNTDTKGDSQTRLVLQNGGVLVLRHSSGRALWTSAAGPSFGWRLASLLP
ncbi:g9402 [Coccomyxa elongata]